MAGGEEHSSDARDEIMIATYRAITKQGFANLTLQSIADEMEKSRTLLHYHYDTKDELLAAFIDYIVGWIGDRIAESEMDHPVDKFEEFIHRFVLPADPDREPFARAILELRLQAVHDDRYREKMQAHYRENIRTCDQILSEGIENGYFTQMETEQVAESIYTSMVGARTYQVTLSPGNASGRMATQLWEFARHTFFTDEAHSYLEDRDPVDFSPRR